MKYPQLVSMPSAVSDWLQEQLEARGIDSVLYTRYVLSLLHSHPVDLIYQDDLRLSHLKKEVGKSNGGRKRSRKSSSDWWRYAQADAEQIKRSAAVECLVSASDQNCEIESLVDELCEKLKEVESISTTPILEQDTSAEEQSEVRKLTPQELAEKYYAAFPPLCPQSPTESKLLALIPKWKPTISPIKMKPVRKQGNRTVGYENKLHAKENSEMKARTQNKQRLSLISRTKNTISRNNTAFANWDFTVFNRRFGAPKLKSSPDMEHEPLDQCVEVDQEIWENPEVNIYEDLPVDIKELLDSPLPSEDNVKKISANMSNGGKPEYIQYGTNIMSSIWSTDSDVAGNNNFNSAVASSNDFGLDSKFSSISIDNNAEPIDEWLSGNVPVENSMKTLFEHTLGLRSSKCNLPESDTKQYRSSKQGEAMDRFAFSLLQINHDREGSHFARVTPKCNEAYNPFTVKPRKYPIFRSSRRSLNFDKDEDLLTSEKSHFKPITEKLEHCYTQYADGATFVISNKLDKVDYKRSASGTMCLETNQGQKKKYFEYKNDEIYSTPDGGFVLKFIVSQNDKGCQTEEPSELDFETVKNKFEEDTHEIIYAPETPVQYCTCIDDKIPATITDDSTICPLHPARPESALGEIWWKYEMKICEKCNNNNYTSTSADWSNKGQTDSDWDDQGLRDIWSGEEVCQACSLSNAGGIPRPTANLQLREDIIQDGEELFSDLRTVQKNYMEELPLEISPLAEPSIDLTELVSAPPKERKRRHSFILEQHQSAWSFASRLEEDCLIQMSTLPTLRSVTL